MHKQCFPFKYKKNLLAKFPFKFGADFSSVPHQQRRSLGTTYKHWRSYSIVRVFYGQYRVRVRTCWFCCSWLCLQLCCYLLCSAERVFAWFSYDLLHTTEQLHNLHIFLIKRFIVANFLLWLSEESVNRSLMYIVLNIFSVNLLLCLIGGDPNTLQLRLGKLPCPEYSWLNS